MSEQFREHEALTNQARRTNISPLAMASLAVTLAATVIGLCCFAGLSWIGGVAAMGTGFACFFVNREKGSRRDLMIAIASMVIGFMITGYSIYAMRNAAAGERKEEQQNQQILDAMGLDRLIPGSEPAQQHPPARTSPQDPFRRAPAMPEPTRPATKRNDPATDGSP